MEEEKDAFYVVKKGDVIGIYKSLRDLAEAGISVYDPSLRVYKGYGLSKQAEVYLGSCGLKNAAYSISASDVNDNTFGKLVPCPPQQPTSVRGNTSNTDPSPNRQQQILGKELVGSTSHFTDPRLNHMNFANQVETQMMSSNPVCRLCEGVGIATNNVAEYRAVILGMKYALKKGFKHIRVQGDSNLVCMQVQGRWKIKSQNLVELNKEAKELKDKFMSFQINHVGRESNSEADALANQAVNLMNGQVQEDWIGP
ncbi:uncharacterized protein LOC111315949 isoform X3 [Durio zibethinus]|uniref:Uncharacterized protein LOC111315949 isoform X3 n=1 Tax=Durio zibethinus TaxID=66656 RepID=A0A6P6B948_DURZI|nr:uncharacterized protein LOC111315949 isoform X3 [Durio zibethinus]